MDYGASTREANSSRAVEYLRRQIYLLLEDFCRPLRAALAEIERGQRTKSCALLRDLGGGRVVGRCFDRSARGYRLRLEGTGVEPPLPGCLIVLRCPRALVLAVSSERGLEVDNHISVDILTQDDAVVKSIAEAVEVSHSLQMSTPIAEVLEYTVYYEAYRHQLASLSHRLSSDSPAIPLGRYIVEGDKEIRLPIYLTSSPLMRIETIVGNKVRKGNNLTDVSDVYKLLFSRRPDHEALETGSGKADILADDSWSQLDDEWDKSQIAALRASLSQELALVQGPPGTGKSTVGIRLVEVLLRNRHLWAGKSSSTAAPLVVICYTNRALDGFLEAALDTITGRLVRIGGRSESSKLEIFNLSRIRQHMKENQLRSQHLYEQEKELYTELDLVKRALEAVGHGPVDPQLVARIEAALAGLRRVSDQETRHICSRADILGLTSTGAAKYRQLLEDMKAKIFIMEEAGEILESHVVASLPTSCQHLVMIGDHLQLRPAVASHDLQLSEQHDVSLFERLVTSSGLPFSSLTTQYRMSPEIADLVRPLYPQLQDHPSVRARDRILGVKLNLQFLDHSHPESSAGGSRCNKFEAEMSVELACHLVDQGVAAGQITILTPYTGQLRLIRDELTARRLPDKGGLECHTVDSYQGQENDVIILSLVRSGDRAGFLALDNRVVVALSRARRGLYILGSWQLLSQASPFWAEVGRKLEARGASFSALQLTCGSHSRRLTAATLDDLQSLRKRGCSNPCGKLLPCGHPCARLCHALSLKHSCEKPCGRRCSRGLHACSRPCQEACGKCSETIQITLSCGHVAEGLCHQSIQDHAIRCSVKEPILLDCGHEGLKTCGEVASCAQPCPFILDCGHACPSACHAGSAHAACTAPCARLCTTVGGVDAASEDGHACSRRCGEPCGSCSVAVRRQLIGCSHMAVMACGQPVEQYECVEKCQRSLDCGHPCRELCYEPCGPCPYYGDLQLGCGHTGRGACRDRARNSCVAQCDRPLPGCGHSCGGLCGQPCDSVRCEVMVAVDASASGDNNRQSCPHRQGRVAEAVLVPCYRVAEASDSLVDTSTERGCDEMCGALLSCGHACCGACAECRATGLHAACRSPCGRQLVCGHACKGAACGEPCSPCSAKTLFRCPHGPFKSRCGEPLRPACKEKCGWRCGHLKCGRKCSAAPCGRGVCEQRCGLRVPACGHACCAACGELCACSACAGLSEPEADIVALSCGCVLTASSLLQHNRRDAIGVFECPKCSAPVVHLPRFQSEIYARYEEVCDLNDHLFAASTMTGLKARQTALMEKIGVALDAKSADAMEGRKALESLTLQTTLATSTLSSRELGLLETKAAILIILMAAQDKKDGRIGSLCERIAACSAISRQIVANLRELLMADGEGEAAARLDGEVKMMSYEKGLWKRCDSCGIIHQGFCQSCGHVCN